MGIEYEKQLYSQIEGLRFEMEGLYAEIERLRAEHEVTAANLHAWMKLKADAEARLAEAVEVLLDVNDAAQIDVLMEGPRLQGWRRSELDRLWPKLRAFLAMGNS